MRIYTLAENLVYQEGLLAEHGFSLFIDAKDKKFLRSSVIQTLLLFLLPLIIISNLNGFCYGENLCVYSKILY